MRQKQLFEQAKFLNDELLSDRKLYKDKKNKYDNQLKKLRKKLKQKEELFIKTLRKWFKDINPKNVIRNINHQNDMLDAFEHVLREELIESLNEINNE